MADLEALANEYLVTPAGRTAADPCGAWCGDGDVDAWVTVVRRIRMEMARLVKANQGLPFPGELVVQVLQWQFDSRAFGGGNITHVFGAGTDEVIGLVAFARRGVQLMFELEVVVDQEGGTIPGLGPMPPALPSVGSQELWWLAGGAMLALVLLELWRSR